MSQTGATPFLPFHCERLDGDFLLSPCAKNLRQVKERMDKFPSARLGPLEHCRVCQGAGIDHPVQTGGDASRDAGVTT